MLLFLNGTKFPFVVMIISTRILTVKGKFFPIFYVNGKIRGKSAGPDFFEKFFRFLKKIF